MFDSKDKAKQSNARMIFAALVTSQRCCISTQVLQESFNVLTKKLRYTKDEALGIVSNLMNLPVHQITTSDVAEAMRISRATQYTIYDSMILAAAKAEGCDTVYSEDLNNGQEINGVKIENPLI
ncbi:MAG: PIN domain-containing protein [Treponema sp.]|nr:PIN domain-containing protein [Treponema sp.]